MKNFLVSLFLTVLSFTSYSEPAREKWIREMVSEYDVSPSLEKAVILSPKNILYISFDEFSKQDPVNVVILMHGCGGIASEELAWAKFLKDNGYYVVLPNSYAIAGRHKNCDPSKFVTNLNKLPAVPLRVVESLHAISEIKKLNSVKHVFLMGHSEGGGAITLLPMKMVSGVISSGSFCNRIIDVDKSVPLLTINHQTDPYFPTRYSCKEKTSYRATSTTEVLLSGNGHDTSYHTTARQSVLEFLKLNS